MACACHCRGLPAGRCCWCWQPVRRLRLGTSTTGAAYQTWRRSASLPEHGHPLRRKQAWAESLPGLGHCASSSSRHRFAFWRCLQQKAPMCLGDSQSHSCYSQQTMAFVLQHFTTHTAVHAALAAGMAAGVVACHCSCRHNGPGSERAAAAHHAGAILCTCRP